MATFKLRDLECPVAPTAHPVRVDAWSREQGNGYEVKEGDGNAVPALCSSCGAQLRAALSVIAFCGGTKKSSTDGQKPLNAPDDPGASFPIAETEQLKDGCEFVHVDRGSKETTVLTQNGEIANGDKAFTVNKATGVVEVGYVKKIETVSTDSDGSVNQRLHVDIRMVATPKKSIQ